MRAGGQRGKADKGDLALRWNDESGRPDMR